MLNKLMGGVTLVAAVLLVAGCTNGLWHSNILLPLENGSAELEADIRRFYEIVDDVCSAYSLDRTESQLRPQRLDELGLLLKQPLVVSSSYPEVICKGKGIDLSVIVTRYGEADVRVTIYLEAKQLRWPADRRYRRFREEMRSALVKTFSCERLEVWDNHHADRWMCE